MVLIESSDSEDEILIKDEPKPSSSSPQPDTMAATEAKQVDGDESDGFETASEREISDEEGEEDDIKNDAVTSQDETNQSDKPEKKEEQTELMREAEAITDDGSNQVSPT